MAQWVINPACPCGIASLMLGEVGKGSCFLKNLRTMKIYCVVIMVVCKKRVLYNNY